MEDDLGGADQGEAHAETQQTSTVGNVRRLGDLLVLLEALGVRVLDEDVEHDEVLPGVVEDHFLYGTVARVAVGHHVPPYVPVVVLAKLHRLEGLQDGADVGVLPLQGLPLGPVALFHEPLGHDAKLLPVDEGLPVRVRAGGDEEAVDLVLACGPALDKDAVVVYMVELAHPVHQVVHAGEVGADAHVVVLHGVLAAHGVEA